MVKAIYGNIAITVQPMPSTEDGALDEEGLRNQIDFCIRKGSHVVSCFSGGDFAYTDAERKRITKILVDEVNGRVPCYMGACGFDTEQAIRRAKAVEDAGCDGIFMTGPPREFPVDIVEHYRKVNKAINIPLFIYNTPGPHPGIMPPEKLMEIEKAAPNLKYVKVGNPTMEETRVLVDGLAAGKSKLKLVAGKSYFNFHQLYYAWNIYRPVGLAGYLPGLLPAEHTAMWNAFVRNDFEQARKVWVTKIAPFAELMASMHLGWGASREILRQFGIMKSSHRPVGYYGSRPDPNPKLEEYLRKEVAAYIELVQPDIE